MRKENDCVDDLLKLFRNLACRKSPIRCDVLRGALSTD